MCRGHRSFRSAAPRAPPLEQHVSAAVPPPAAELAQRFDAARSPVEPGRSLIEASAGTGKTFALVALFLRLVLEGRRAERLLVVTFTVDATEELTGRIREALRAAEAVFTGAPNPQPNLDGLLGRFEEHFAATDEVRRQSVSRLRRARADAGALSVFTIHGFCKHALEEWAFESGTAFRIDFAEEADDLLRRAAADCWQRRLDDHPLLAEAAVALGWDAETLLGHMKKTGRHPGTEVVPAVELDAALDDLNEALDRLQSAWDAEALEERFASFVWKKSARFTAATLPRHLKRVSACAEGRLAEGLAAARAFGTLREHANKNRTSRTLLEELCAHAGPKACAAVARAAERLEHAFVRWFTQAAPRRFRALKRRRRVMTFDDLLAELLRALEDPAQGPALAKAVRAEYDLALVDEFQDTDPRQYAIFREIFGAQGSGQVSQQETEVSTENSEKPVFLIGDAKQAIYRFRGADLYTYLDARREAGRRFTLGKNWRSDTRLVDAVNAVFAQAPVPFLHEDIPFAPVEAEGTPDDAPLTGDGKAPLVWWYHPPQRYKNGGLKVASKSNARPRLYAATAGEIGRLLSGGMSLGDRPLRANDIAVLVRTNKQAQKMQAALQQSGIPAVVSAARSIMETREMAEIETLLRAVLEPRPEHIRAALATELWGCTARDIFDIKEDAARWAGLVRRFESWQDDWQTRGVAYVLTRFLDAEGVRERLLSFGDGERRLTNVRHCVELLNEAEQRRRQAPSGLLRWLARREETSLLEGEETELRLESDERAVQVRTLHKSKGLEFNVVFCPFLWHTYFDESQHPLVQKDGRVVYDLGSEERGKHLDRLRAEELAEEIRLTYVGLTRAVHRCYVAWGDLRSAPDSALGYLLHVGAADLDAAKTPVARAEAARKAAQEAQATALGPQRLRDLFAEHDHIDIEHLDDVEQYAQAQRADSSGDGAALQPRTADAALAARLTPWTYASYSAWTHETYDDNSPPHAPPVAEESSDPKGFCAFAAGLRAGQCLHEILEHVDFAAAPDADTNRRWVNRLLRRHRLDDAEHHHRPIDPEGVVLDLLGTLRDVPLPGASFTLTDVAWKKRANEWSFSLPIAETAPRRLRPAFAEADAALPQDYAPHLRDLDAEDADGFLRGAADLVFEKGGAYYLVDWKSTLLADTPDGYDDETLRAAMLDHHYVLQYHLYAAALQRHLTHRLPDYDPQQHFGGVWYVFLRGLQPGAQTGLFFDRPNPSLLTAINRRLGEQRAAP